MVKISTIMIGAFFFGMISWYFFGNSIFSEFSQKFVWKSFLRSRELAVEHILANENGGVRMKLTTTNATDTNAGTSPNHLGMYLDDSTDIFSLHANIHVREIMLNSCEENPAPAFSRVAVGGYFFNAIYPDPLSEAGDVFAATVVARDSASALPDNMATIKAVVFMCTTHCYFRRADTPPGEEPVTVLFEKDIALIHSDRDVGVGLTWNKESREFFFYHDNEIAARYTYPEERLFPPFKKFKNLNVAAFVPNCMNNKLYGTIDAYVSDVLVNGKKLVLDQ